MMLRRKVETTSEDPQGSARNSPLKLFESTTNELIYQIERHQVPPGELVRLLTLLSGVGLVVQAKTELEDAAKNANDIDVR